MDDRYNEDEYNRYGCGSVCLVGYRDQKTGKVVLYDKPWYPSSSEPRPSRDDLKPSNE